MPVETFRLVATCQDVFGEKACGNCGSAKIKFTNRHTKNGTEIFEIVCQECRAALTLWPTKDGAGLFVKRWDSEKRCEVGKNGWVKYERSQQPQSAPAGPPNEPEGTPF